MSAIRWIILLAILTLPTTTVYGQLNANVPHIGYLYPAGAQQGTTVKIGAGGQFLRGINEVHISGDGVTAKVIQYMRPLGNINKDSRDMINASMNEAFAKYTDEMPGKKVGRNMPAAKATPKKKEEEKNPKTRMPEHPLLYELEEKSMRELIHVQNQIFMPRSKLQPNRQLAENVLIEITVAPDAKPGPREIRLESNLGLTNPMIFQVGLLPEKYELEPNDSEADPRISKFPNLRKQRPITLPAVLNGQIKPGDVDRFCFRAVKGQQLVIETQARSLIPYLADAVPGWFQATVALFDSIGHEVAFADDFRFNPDPVLFYTIEKDGKYELEIRDSIYRGRDDFVYRVSVSEQPFITQVYPLGGREGHKSKVSVSGWNLPETQLRLNTKANGRSIRKTAYHADKKASNAIPYAVDSISEFEESESNDTIKDADTIFLPTIVNGRIDKPGDKDFFKFNGVKGGRFIAEVNARRLNSPLDSIVRLTDGSGKVIAWNDDYVVEDSHLYKDVLGLTTHHADSYLSAELPRSGTYYVQIADSQNYGSQAHAYRLRLSKPRPDFELRVTPSSMNIPVGGTIPIRVHAIRKDGFDGEIDISLKDSPEGFQLHGAKIPAGTNSIRLTMFAPYKTPTSTISFEIRGSAVIKGETISHTAVPAEDMMQAFLYRHLVPSEELMVAVLKKGGKTPPVKIAGTTPIEIPVGGSAKVRLRVPLKISGQLKGIKLSLYEPPKGITLGDVTVNKNELVFVVMADKDTVSHGLRDNLIIEAIKEYYPKGKDGKPQKQKKNYSMGVIPAIPVHVAKLEPKKT